MMKMCKNKLSNDTYYNIRPLLLDLDRKCAKTREMIVDVYNTGIRDMDRCVIMDSKKQHNNSNGPKFHFAQLSTVYETMKKYRQTRAIEKPNKMKNYTNKRKRADDIVHKLIQMDENLYNMFCTATVKMYERRRMQIDPVSIPNFLS